MTVHLELTVPTCVFPTIRSACSALPAATAKEEIARGLVFATKVIFALKVRMDLNLPAFSAILAQMPFAVESAQLVTSASVAPRIPLLASRELTNPRLAKANAWCALSTTTAQKSE